MFMVYDVYSSKASLRIVRGAECNQDISDSVKHAVRYGSEMRTDRSTFGRAIKGTYAQMTGGE